MSTNELKNSFPPPSPSQQGVDDFRHAAGRGDKAAVTEFLDKYPAAVNRASIFGDTALVFAAILGRKEIVELLLARGAIVDVPDSNGWTPSLWAALCRHKDIAELLWEKTASPDAKKHREAMKAELELKKSLHPDMPSEEQIRHFIEAAGSGDVNAVTGFLDWHITS